MTVVIRVKPLLLVRSAATIAASTAIVLSAIPAADAPGMTQVPDERAARLGVFFQRYHCPAPHHIRDYLRAADGYGLDYRLLPAISVRETGCGITAKENNRWGYHPGRQTFTSIEVGIDYVARQLAENPLYKGKTVRDKLYTYNPRPAYPREVESIMRTIE